MLKFCANCNDLTPHSTDGECLIRCQYCGEPSVEPSVGEGNRILIHRFEDCANYTPNGSYCEYKDPLMDLFNCQACPYYRSKKLINMRKS